MDYLKDDKLEELGFIKKVDTLEIIEISQRIKEKRRKVMLFILFIIMISTSIIGQVLFIYLFGGVKLMKIGILIYIFISITLALILIDKGEQSLC